MKIQRIGRYLEDREKPWIKQSVWEILPRDVMHIVRVLRAKIEAKEDAE
jgi:hypothetical protein